MTVFPVCDSIACVHLGGRYPVGNSAFHIAVVSSGIVPIIIDPHSTDEYRSDANSARPVTINEHFFVNRFFVQKSKQCKSKKQYAEDRKSTRLNSSHVAISY